MLVAGIAAVFGMCFCIFNYWFQKERYNRMTRNQLAQQRKAASPTTWLVLSIVMFVALLVIISFYIYKYYQAVQNLLG